MNEHTDAKEKVTSQLSSEFSELSVDAISELHKIAQRCMFKENPGHTLQATALVNEAYISLHTANIQVTSKIHFFAMAATHMRRILVDYARKKSAFKREANALAMTANDQVLIDPNSTDSLVLLDEILTQLSELDERAAKLYEMRLFAGLSNAELSEVFGLSVATVERDIRIAKAWLTKQFNNN